MLTRVKRWESLLWRSPQWLTYAIAFGLAFLVLLVRWRFQGLLGDRAVFAFSTVPVGVAALLGGIWPGLVATAVGLVGGMVLLATGQGQATLAAPAFQIQVLSFAAIWTFISFVCDALRRMARVFADNARIQEVQKVRLETILSSITDGFFAVDRDWRITHTNASFRDIVKRSERDLFGRDIWDVLNGPLLYEVRVKLSEAKRADQPVAIDVELQGARWFNLRAFPTADGMFVYIQEITDRKLLEAQRDQLLAVERHERTAAEAASRLKDDFVANLSHELRTPLTTMLGWTEILQMRYADQPGIVDGLQAIERSARHQAQLIDDLLDMSRAMTGKLKLDLNFVSLSELCYEVAESWMPTAESRGITLRVIPSDEPDVVRGDAKRLFQILANLVSNAIKFTSSGGLVELSVARCDDWQCVRVKDDGEGIDPGFLPYLFDRFRQANSTISKRHGGLGLGLAIVKQLTESHGGTVIASSDGIGKGATFEIRLPVAPMAPGEDGIRLGKELGADALAGVRVFVVDDEPRTLDMLRTVLTEHGAEVSTATSATDALNRIPNQEVDVLVSDIGMPELDGFNFITAIRKLPKDQNGEVPAIALTAFATEEDRRKAIEMGFQDHLSKPISLSRLITEVAHFAGKVAPPAPRPG